MYLDVSDLAQVGGAFLAALVLGRALFTTSWLDAAPVALAVALGVAAALAVGDRLWD